VAWLLKLQSKMLEDAYRLLAIGYMTKLIVKSNHEYNYFGSVLMITFHNNYFGNVLQYKYNYFV